MNLKYKLIFSKEARKGLQRYGKTVAQRIIIATELLAEDPYNHPHTKKMRGSNNGSVYRLRVGKFRVIYEIIDDQLLVTIVKIGPRGDIYK